MRNLLIFAAFLAVLPLFSFAQSNELCEGDTVTTNDHLTGVVKQVFPDGIVMVQIYNEGFKYKRDQLSKPISCLENICAGDTVTTNDHLTGVVKQVFPDGVAMVTIHTQVFRYKRDQIAKPISCLGKICAGDTVTTNDHLTGVVNQLFPDGIAMVMMTRGVFRYRIQDIAIYKKCSESGRVNCR